ncbi:MAG: hypothetical protein IJ741_03530 [Schwartzia sp.]|nr:hypothetical protein [Schwartzia sp. (in: firmicutes)]
MKVYVDRDAVLEILSADSSLHDAKKLVEALPTTAVSEDGKTVFHSYGVNPQFIGNAGTMIINL